jgi:hypothetical protein
MSEFEEEDLTRFRFEDLLAVVDEVAAKIEPSENGLRLRKVTNELRKRNPENPKQSGAARPAQIGYAKRSLKKEVPSRTKGLPKPGRRG